eukprot:s1_g2016.t1
MPDEFTLIDELLVPLAGPEGLGLKDDAAVLSPRPGYDLVFTKDAIAEDRHYLPGDPADTVARKLLRVNLSDLAAKGATPCGYLLSCAWSSDTSLEWMERFVEGLRQDQVAFGLHLWGGDTIKTDGPSVFSLTAIGEVPTGQMVTRSGAQVGDDVWVTGTIGDAALGLRAAQGEFADLAADARNALIERYRIPKPPVAFGSKLSRVASAAIDVSDGLLADAGHLCRASNIGIEIEVGSIPLSGSVRACLAQDNRALETVVAGGDDYQLLFTAHPSARPELEKAAEEAGIGLQRVGKAIDGPTQPLVIGVDGTRLQFGARGFQHF